MSIALEDATDALRRKVLRGDYMPAAKLREVGVAEDLGVSRTIARLAMSMLEHEGLLSRAPNRGCRVNRFSIEQIVQAIEVRGNLEAMAARQAAERGLSEDVDSAFDDILQRSAQALAMGVQDGHFGLDRHLHHLRMASRCGFHAAIRLAADPFADCQWSI